jgi:hypothetical protein
LIFVTNNSFVNSNRICLLQLLFFPLTLDCLKLARAQLERESSMTARERREREGEIEREREREGGRRRALLVLLWK